MVPMARRQWPPKDQGIWRGQSGSREEVEARSKGGRRRKHISNSERGSAKARVRVKAEGNRNK